MKAIILLAGVGERLLPLTKYTHKSLIDLGDGTCVLERIIGNFRDCGFIDEIVLVTGHMREQVEDKLALMPSLPNVEVVYNPMYSMCNNLISLWCTHYKMLEDDFIITNGDNYYRLGVFENIKLGRDTIQLTIDKKKSYNDDDMKVSIDGNENISYVSKDINRNDISAESVGLLLVQGVHKRMIFYNSMMDVVREQKMLGSYWLEVINRIIAKGHIVDYYEISCMDWCEIDFKADLDELKDIILRSTISKCDLNRG